MKGVVKILILILIAILGVSFWFMYKTDFKGSYKMSEKVGYSDDILESKNRGVFVKEMKHKILPDSLKLKKDVVFFIERRWRYGKYSAKETLPIGEGELKYSYSYETTSDLFEQPQYALGMGDSTNFNKLKDTFKLDIIYRKDIHKVKSDYDNVSKVGKLFLYASE